jgi:hypothetical protein
MEPVDKCQITPVEDNQQFRAFEKSNPSGLMMVPEPFGNPPQLVMHAAAGEFAKWLRETAPSLNVVGDLGKRRIVLQSGDIWLPLVFLAQDVALPVYLNLVSSYLYERMKGALRGDRSRVHINAIYEDTKSGVVKKFSFEGDHNALQIAIKRVDLNEFLDE